MGEMPSERQVEAGSGGDWKGFGFYSKRDGGGASREAGGCSAQDRDRWWGWGVTLGRTKRLWSGKEGQSRDM